MLDYFQMLARYNRWANARLYEATGQLSDADWRAPRQVFFGSIRHTLNHLLVGDRLWRGRITGEPLGPYTLDQILHDDQAGLAAARVDEDDALVAMTEALTEARIAAVLSYRDSRGNPHQTPLLQVLGHLFNHQTHHRGQVHALMTQAGLRPADADVIDYLDEGAAG